MQKNRRKTLVAAVDTSGVSRSMFKEALVLASSLRARIVVVSVTPEYEGNLNRLFFKEAEQKLSEPFQEILDEAAEYSASLGLDMTTVRRYGKPSEEIVAVARENDADLILLGSSKRLHIERMMLGRTIAEIIHDGPCDVLLIPENAEIRFKRIMVEINRFPEHIESGKMAVDIARSYGSEIHALYVVNIPSEKLLRYRVMQEAEQKASKILEKFNFYAERFDIPIFSDLCWNVPEKCLVEYAQRKDIHLTILSSRENAGMFEMLWGSLVERLASKAVCPVLVAKQRQSEDDENFASMLS